MQLEDMLEQFSLRLEDMEEDKGVRLHRCLVVLTLLLQHTKQVYRLKVNGSNHMLNAGFVPPSLPSRSAVLSRCHLWKCQRSYPRWCCPVPPSRTPFFVSTAFAAWHWLVLGTRCVGSAEKALHGLTM